MDQKRTVLTFHQTFLNMASYTGRTEIVRHLLSLRAIDVHLKVSELVREEGNSPFGLVFGDPSTRE